MPGFASLGRLRVWVAAAAELAGTPWLWCTPLPGLRWPPGAGRGAATCWRPGCVRPPPVEKLVGPVHPGAHIQTLVYEAPEPLHDAGTGSPRSLSLRDEAGAPYEGPGSPGGRDQRSLSPRYNGPARPLRHGLGPCLARPRADPRWGAGRDAPVSPTGRSASQPVPLMAASPPPAGSAHRLPSRPRGPPPAPCCRPVPHSYCRHRQLGLRRILCSDHRVGVVTYPGGPAVPPVSASTTGPGRQQTSGTHAAPLDGPAPPSEV